MIPTLSIIVPTHKRPATLGRLLHSVVESTFKDFEVLVISDCFCEQTVSMITSIKDERISITMNESFVGPSDSRNFGIQCAKGQYCYFIDDDDCVEKDYLKLMMSACSHSKDEVLYSDATIIEEDRAQNKTLKRYPFQTSNLNQDDVWVKNFIHINTIIYPTLLIKNLAFDPYLKSLEDWDFLLSSLREGARLRYVEGIAGAVIFKDYINRNRRGNSENAQNLQALRDYLRIYAKAPAPTHNLLMKRRNFINNIIQDANLDIIEFFT